MSIGGELDQVLVADLVFREQHEMMINIPARTRFLFVAAAGRNVNFAAKDRFNPFVTNRLVEINSAIEDTVIRQRQRRELQFVRFFSELVQTACSIEQRILGMEMQMNKLSVRHGINVLSQRVVTQAAVVNK